MIKIDLKELFAQPTQEKVGDEEFRQMRLKWQNDEVGDLNEEDGINCDICKNKGYYFYEYDKSRRCSCMTKRENYKKLIKNGFEKLLNRTPNHYVVTTEWQRSVKEIMQDYIKNHNDSWFCILGQSGSGKTLVGSIIANQFYNEGIEVMYVTWTDFIGKLKRTIMSTYDDKAIQVEKFINEMCKTKVLFIDELLKKYSEADLKYLIEIINYRYNNDLITIVTSERLLKELIEIDEATFGRIAEKCNGKYLIQIGYDTTKNYRLRGFVAK